MSFQASALGMGRRKCRIDEGYRKSPLPASIVGTPPKR
jgi:hypothetical protein